jgi:hypothetical protein
MHAVFAALCPSSAHGVLLSGDGSSCNLQATTRLLLARHLACYTPMASSTLWHNSAPVASQTYTGVEPALRSSGCVRLDQVHSQNQCRSHPKTQLDQMKQTAGCTIPAQPWH